MKKILQIAVIVIILLSIISCSKNQETNNSKIRVGFFPNITHSQALLGKEDGQFKKALANYEVEWKMFNAGPAEMEAMLAGELDIAYIGSGPAVSSYVKSKGDIQIVAGAANAGATLISRKDLKISDLKELENKKIAIPQFGNTQDLILRSLLEQNGLKDTTKGGNVQIYQVENSDLKILLEKGDIDVALVPEPWGSTFVNEIGANMILDYNKLWRSGNYPTAVIVARKDFIKKHPEIVEAFLKTHIELTNILAKKNDETKQAVNNQINTMTKKSLPKDIFDAAYNRVIPTYDIDKDSMGDFIDLLNKIGAIKEKPDTSNLFDLSILNKLKEN